MSTRTARRSCYAALGAALVALLLLVHPAEGPAASRQFVAPKILRRLPFNQASTAQADPLTGRVWITQAAPTYVKGTSHRSDGVTVLAPGTFTVLKHLRWAGTEPATDVIFDGNTAYLVLANSKLVLVDTRTYRTVRTVRLGLPAGSEQSLAVDQAARRLYVTGPHVTVYSLETFKKVGTLAATGESVAVNPVTNEVWTDNYSAATAQVFDAYTNKLVKTIQIGAPGRPKGCEDKCKVIPAGPDGLAVNPATNTIYVDDTNSGQLFVIDGHTYKWVKFLQASTPGTYWAAVDPKRNLTYSINDNTSTLTTVDGATNTELTHLSIGVPQGPKGCDIFGYAQHCTTGGSGPANVSVDPLNGDIYIANYGDTAFVAAGWLKKPATAGKVVVLSPGHWRRP